MRSLVDFGRMVAPSIGHLGSLFIFRQSCYNNNHPHHLLFLSCMKQKSLFFLGVIGMAVVLLGAGCSSKTTTSVDTTPVQPSPAGETRPTAQEMDDMEPEDVTVPDGSTPDTVQPEETKSDVTVDVKTDVSVTPGAAVKEFTISGSNMKFEPATMTVKKGDKVKITFKNVGGFHDLVIDEFNVETDRLNAGAQQVVEFTADKVGTFEYYCSVGNHRAMGMKGTLTVE